MSSFMLKAQLGTGWGGRGTDNTCLRSVFIDLTPYSLVQDKSLQHEKILETIRGPGASS